MKILLLMFLVLGTAKTNITLRLDYPTNDVSGDLSFNFYHATNMVVSITNWTVLTNVWITNMVQTTSTNPGMGTFSFTMSVTPGNHFYFASTTNGWGESDPSNLTSTNIPRRGQDLNIGRGP